MRIKVDDYDDIVKIDGLFFLGTTSNYCDKKMKFNTISKEHAINILLDNNLSDKDIMDFINSEDRSQTEKMEEKNIDFDKITYSFIRTSMESKSLSIILDPHVMTPEVYEETPVEYFQVDIMYYKDSDSNEYFIIDSHYDHHEEKVFTSLSELVMVIKTIFTTILFQTADWIQKYDIKYLSEKITEKIEGE